MFRKNVNSFLFDHEIIDSLNECILVCEKNIKICSPYNHPDSHFMTYLIEALKNDVIVLFIGRNPSDTNDFRALKKLHNHGAKVYINDYLHAKVFLGDNNFLFVGSLNLQVTSMARNHEAAFLTTDKMAIKKANSYFDFLVNNSQSDWETHSNVKSYNDKKEKEIGYCIICNEEIEFKITLPVCSKCYNDYKIRKLKTTKLCFCHSCGNKAKIGFEQPLCISCINLK